MLDSDKQKRRTFWLKQFYLWHWTSSAICLIGMLLFAATGLTLNNATWIKSTPAVIKQTADVPELLRPELQKDPPSETFPLPAAITDWVTEVLSIDVTRIHGEWSDDEIYLSLPRPGGDAWLVIDRENGELTYERTDRGWVSYFNDLHKGRHTGLAWSWFLDVFSIATLIFSMTGLCLLYMHTGSRPATWPLVTLGVIMPLVLAILFIH